MTAERVNCSTECPLDGTPRAPLRRLLHGSSNIHPPEQKNPAVKYRRRSRGQNEYRARID
jgi:hypothetical protein